MVGTVVSEHDLQKKPEEQRPRLAAATSGIASVAVVADAALAITAEDT